MEEAKVKIFRQLAHNVDYADGNITLDVSENDIRVCVFEGCVSDLTLSI